MKPDKRPTGKRPRFAIGRAMRFARHEDQTRLHQSDGRFMPLERQEFAGLRSQAPRHQLQITRLEQEGGVWHKTWFRFGMPLREMGWCGPQRLR